MAWALTLLVLGAHALSSVESPSTEQTHCAQPIQRKAWHTLTNNEKQAYLDAEVCLMKTPTWTEENFSVATTLFQALQEQHQLQSDYIHEVGAFLPFHRYMTWAHEHLLRTKCGYTGAQPWWDEERDAAHFANSSLFDAEFGFGGRSPGCVQDGPFANYTLIIGPGTNNTVHCLSRAIDDVASSAASSFWQGFVNNATTFEEAWDRIEFYPHSAGHSGTGGEMLNPISSPGDPMFYVHHAYIDKLWWDWQARNLSSRLYAIGGPNVQDPTRPTPIPPFFPPGVGPQRRTLTRRQATTYHAAGVDMGDPGSVTTLGHRISLYGILDDVKAVDVMDIRTERLCYEYV